MYASFLFLAVVLNYPFQGDFGLAPAPFEFVASQIGVDCSDRIIPAGIKEYNTPCPISSNHEDVKDTKDTESTR
jgi:hypothetical protein